jgi:hypothetical protein
LREKLLLKVKKCQRLSDNQERQIKIQLILDALLSLSLMNYNKTLVDNVSNAHPFWEKLKNKFKGKNGGVAVKQNLRYANKQGTTFAGYDEITITPTDGITQSTSECAIMRTLL